MLSVRTKFVDGQIGWPSLRFSVLDADFPSCQYLPPDLCADRSPLPSDREAAFSRRHVRTQTVRVLVPAPRLETGGTLPQVGHLRGKNRRALLQVSAKKLCSTAGLCCGICYHSSELYVK